MSEQIASAATSSAPSPTPTPAVAVAASPTALWYERDGQGRYAQGNKGGPGNPFARQVALLRRELIDCTTRADIREVASKLLAMAKEGNVAAAKLLFSYVLGKPGPAPDPDRLDHEEWKNYKDAAPMMMEMPAMVSQPAPCLPLDMVRATKPGVTSDLAAEFGHALKHPEEHQKETWQLVAGRKPKNPSPQPLSPEYRGEGHLGTDPAQVSVASSPSGNGQPKANGKRAKHRAGAPSANGQLNPPLPTPSAEWEKLIQERMSGPAR